MSYATLAYAIQYFNIILGLIAFLWILQRLVGRRSEYPDEIRKILAATTGLIFTLIVVSGEQILNDIPLEFSAILITFVKVALLYVLWATRNTKYRTGTRQKDGNPLENVNKDVR